MLRDLNLRVWNRLQLWLTYALGIAIGLSALFVWVSFVLKSCYYNDIRILFASGRIIVGTLFQMIPPLRWIWPFLRYSNGTLEDLLLSVPFFILVGGMLIGGGIVRYAARGQEVLDEVVKGRRISRLRRKHEGDNNQSMENVTAGRDVVMIRHEMNEERLSDWQQGWAKLFGGIGAAVLASVLAAVITQVTGLTH